MTMATRTAPSGFHSPRSREARQKRDERIFASLPPLGSIDYLEFLKSARRHNPPARVLVRAYRTLFPSHAADATLARLADRDNPPGYLARVLVRAYERAARLGAYTADDLVANTIGEIVATIAGPKGAIAEGAWALYLETCMEEAFRGLVGRTGARAGSHAASNGAADDDVVPGASTEAIAATAWRARVEPDHLEWLESFIERTMAKIPDADMRAIALDLFSETPTPVHSTDPNEQNTLTRRFGVNRKTIYRWQANVRSLLYHALNRQNERMIDLSFLAYRS